MATLSIRVSDKTEAFATAEATKRGLSDAAAYAASLLEETASQNGSETPLTQFHDAKTDLDSLLRAQDVKPITNVGDLVADFWPEDESADDFVAALRQWRRGDSSINLGQ